MSRISPRLAGEIYRLADEPTYYETYSSQVAKAVKKFDPAILMHKHDGVYRGVVENRL